MKMNATKWLVAAGLAVFFPLVVLAQEAPAAGDGVVPAAKARSPGAEAERGGAPGRDGRRAAAVERFIQKMKVENPAEFKRLQELRQNDQEAFRKEMRERWQKKNGENREEGHKADGKNATLLPEEMACQEVARKYRAAQTPEAAAKLKAELTAAVERTFDARIADQETRLQKAAADLAKRKARKGEVCARRVEELTKEHPARAAKGANRESHKEHGASVHPAPPQAQPGE